MELQYLFGDVVWKMQNTISWKRASMTQPPEINHLAFQKEHKYKHHYRFILKLWFRVVLRLYILFLLCCFLCRAQLYTNQVSLLHPVNDRLPAHMAHFVFTSVLVPMVIPLQRVWLTLLGRSKLPPWEGAWEGVTRGDRSWCVLYTVAHGPSSFITEKWPIISFFFSVLLCFMQMLVRQGHGCLLSDKRTT